MSWKSLNLNVFGFTSGRTKSYLQKKCFPISVVLVSFFRTSTPRFLQRADPSRNYSTSRFKIPHTLQFTTHFSELALFGVRFWGLSQVRNSGRIWEEVERGGVDRPFGYCLLTTSKSWLAWLELAFAYIPASSRLLSVLSLFQLTSSPHLCSIGGANSVAIADMM